MCSNDDKLLLILHQLGHILTEQRERRVSTHDISLLQELDALGAPEVAVTLKGLHLDLRQVRDAVAVAVAVIDDVHGFFGVVLREQVGVLILITGGDKPLQAEGLEVQLPKPCNEIAPVLKIAK